MKSFKIDDEDIKKAVANLRQANAMLSEGKKLSEGAKAVIRNRLLELREVDLAALPIGEMVNVEKLILIEVGKQSRFDEHQFQLDQPESYLSYKKDFPVLKFKPLA